MALDGAMLHLIKDGLQRELIGARVDKISQPSKDEIVISLRRPGDNCKLFLSANSSSARVHLTQQQFENPKRPLMFCMLLRKILGGAKLTGVRQPGLDRILFFDFEGTNEIGDLVAVTVAAEIMGRRSNIILIDHEGRVIDAVKRIDEEISRVRLILPGVHYELPPSQGKIDLLDCDIDSLVNSVAESSKVLSKALIEYMEGISPIVAREISYRVFHGDEPADDMDEQKRRLLRSQLEKIRKILIGGKSEFQSVYETDGKPIDFSFMDIEQYGNAAEIKHFKEPGELLDSYYSERDRMQRVKQRSGDLFKLVSNLRDRTSRRVEVQREELKKSKGRDRLRILGDIVSANIYGIKKGDSLLKTTDFYTGKEVEIPLDPALTPSANAQKYYTEFKRETSAEKNLTLLIEKGEEELGYIDSVYDALERATGEQDLMEIWDELKSQGYLKGSHHKQLKTDKPRPLEYRSSDGHVIFVGRNNVQNDKLTLKTAGKSDVWFHVKNIPGSHVVVVSNGEELPGSTILEAAEIAAYNSKAAHSSQVPVDYTEVKNIKKPAGARPGKVIYDRYHTVYVTPDEDKVKNLKR